jgi:hypothetical protein
MNSNIESQCDPTCSELAASCVSTKTHTLSPTFKPFGRATEEKLRHIQIEVSRLIVRLDASTSKGKLTRASWRPFKVTLRTVTSDSSDTLTMKIRSARPWTNTLWVSRGLIRYPGT